MRCLKIPAMYPTENIIFTEFQKKNSLRRRGHLAFRECTLKSYSPVAVYPTENNILHKAAPSLMAVLVGAYAYSTLLLTRLYE